MGLMATDDQRSTPIDLSDAYALVTTDDHKRLYAKWADNYDETFAAQNRYRSPREIANLFVQVVPAQARPEIADIGCGTGLVGQRLAELLPGAQIDGIDISTQMLEQARTKIRPDKSPVYRNTIEADLTADIAIGHDSYDALISVGTFTHGHLGPEIIRKLISLVRIGGSFVIGVNSQHFAARGFDLALSELWRDELITEPKLHEIQIYEEGSKHFGDIAKVVTFRRTR